jgi:hypothetical protein
MLRGSCERHGRDPADLMLVCSAPVRLDIEGGAAAVVDELRRYEELGVHHVQVGVGGSSERSALDALRRWGDEVVARLHG